MRKLFISLFIVSIAAQAQAADLVLVCDVKEIDKNLTKTAYQRRYEITVEPHYFKAFINKGTGFRPDGDGFPKVINDTRIVFTADSAVNEYYDRNTQEYFYKNSSTEVEATGPCTVANGKGND